MPGLVEVCNAVYVGPLQVSCLAGLNSRPVPVTSPLYCHTRAEDMAMPDPRYNSACRNNEARSLSVYLLRVCWLFFRPFWSEFEAMPVVYIWGRPCHCYQIISISPPYPERNESTTAAATSTAATSTAATSKSRDMDWAHEWA